MNKYKEAIESLNRLRLEDADSWGIYFLGTQIFIGNTRVYTSEAKANNRLQDYLGNDYLSRNSSTEKLVNKLLESGMLEFRKTGDRSPKFPYNIRNLEKEQADKFTKMLDASDEEMCSLAITILEALNKGK